MTYSIAERAWTRSTPTEATCCGAASTSRDSRSVVEALRGELFRPVVPELHLHEDLVAVGLEGVQGYQREAAVGDRFLVDRLAVELGGGRDGPLEEGPPPDEGDGAGTAVLAPPAADHLVVEVDAPVGVVLGEDGGEVGSGAEAGGVAIGGLDIGDVAEHLDRSLAALGARGAGNPHPAAPGAPREPFELAVGAHPLGQLGERVAGGAELAGEALGEAAVRDPLLGAVGDEAGDRAGIRRHGGRRAYSAPAASRRSAAACSGG